LILAHLFVKVSQPGDS